MKTIPRDMNQQHPQTRGVDAPEYKQVAASHHHVLLVGAASAVSSAVSALVLPFQVVFPTHFVLLAVKNHWLIAEQ
jgi:hypothetical protein